MIAALLTFILTAVVLALLLAPLESLSWYAGWFGEADAKAQGKTAVRPGSASLRVGATPAHAARHYLVYLSGIGAIDPTTIPAEEYPLLDALERRLPATRVVADVFPYAPENHGLTGHRAAARVWRWLSRLRLEKPHAALAMLVNLRNLFQVLVSADPRYGPIANLGVARAIRDGLLAAGYRPGAGVPVTLVGVSGGGQMAVGAAYYLKPMLLAPVSVISVGGVMCSDPGLERITHLWHLYGSRDKVQGLGRWIFPGRWPLRHQSFWNRAVAAGKVTLLEIGPYNHNGREHYYDQTARLPGGETYMGHVVDVICGLIHAAGLDPGAPARQEPAPGAAPAVGNIPSGGM
jgi:hypothetical protein